MESNVDSLSVSQFNSLLRLSCQEGAVCIIVPSVRKSKAEVSLGPARTHLQPSIIFMISNLDKTFYCYLF